MSSKEHAVESDNLNQFIIEPMQLDDIEAATAMRLNSWLDTYVNQDLGVTRQWIESRNRQKMAKSEVVLRRQSFISKSADDTAKSWIARDEKNLIIGEVRPYVDENGIQYIGSLYVDKKWHGKGVAGQLMQKAIDWLDASKPIELGVISYNDRAKAFYKKWGFKEVPNSETMFDDKIPEIKMIRNEEEA